MKLSMIVAMAKNRAIGKNGQMPWHLPADLKHFKTITMGKPIIMGRKTFDSIGRALPGRRNLVISRQANLQLPDCETFTSIEAALDAVKKETEVMIIGGATLYENCLPKADQLHLTLINTEFDADTFFPELDETQWEEVSRENHLPDEKNAYPYEFIKLIKQNN